MLSKLLKYDFKSIIRITVIVTLIAVGAAAIGTVAMRLMQLFLRINTGIAGTIISSSIIYLVIACFLIVTVYAFAVIFFVIKRYYTNFFTDEGYLTFTLPARPVEHLASKYILGFSLAILAIIIEVLLFIVLLTFGTADEGEVANNDIIRDLLFFLDQMFGFSESRLLTIEIILNLVFGVFRFISQAFLAITIGSIIARKHKIAAGIGFYFLISLAKSIIENSITVILILVSGGFNIYFYSDSSFIYVIPLLQLAISIGIIIASFFINKHLLSKKLNLS